MCDISSSSSSSFAVLTSVVQTVKDTPVAAANLDCSEACYNLCLLAFEAIDAIDAWLVAFDHSRVGGSLLDAFVLLFALGLGP